MTRRLRPHPTKVATVKFCAGAVLFPLWYAAGAAVAWVLWSPAAALVALVALPVGGGLALRWLPTWRALRSQAAAGAIGGAARAELERLRAERAELADEARGFWKAWAAGRSW